MPPKIKSSKVQCTKQYAVSVFLAFTQQNYTFLVYGNNDYHAVLSCLREVAKKTVEQNPLSKKEIIDSFKQESAYIRSRAKDFTHLINNLRMMGYHCSIPVVVQEGKNLGEAVYYDYA